MLPYPARLASTHTAMPFKVSLVMTWRLRLWLLASLMPVFLHVQRNHGTNILVAPTSTFDVALATLKASAAADNYPATLRAATLGIPNGHM